MAAIQGAIGAAGGASSMFGGQAASAAAQMVTQLANRAAAFAGQAAGIGVSGLGETFLPSSEGGDFSRSWFGKLAGGFSGARPAAPQMAGQAAPPQKEGEGQGQKSAVGEGPQGENVGVKIDKYYVQKNEDRAGQELARHQGWAKLAAAGHR
jgi:hypothetical protein